MLRPKITTLAISKPANAPTGSVQGPQPGKTATKNNVSQRIRPYRHTKVNEGLRRFALPGPRRYGPPRFRWGWLWLTSSTR